MASKVAILKTLIYSDVFDYPLTKEEIWGYLISERSVPRKEFEEELNKVSGAKLIHLEGGRFYCLFGREEIVKKRIKRKRESRGKLELAKKVIKQLSKIPTVLFVGISGGLAIQNADEKDDIDLFVIASKGNLWITRLLLVFLLKLMGQYRGRGKKESQKTCLNMLIDEEALMFKKSRHNLYIAHEIVQLKPVFDRNNTYNKFLFVNKWVEEFMPNAIYLIKNYESRIKNKQKKSLFIIHYSLFIFEQLAKTLQLLYMRKHRTNETVSNNVLAFHPFDYGKYVLREYNKRLRKYEI